MQHVLKGEDRDQGREAGEVTRIQSKQLRDRVGSVNHGLGKSIDKRATPAKV